MKRTIHCVIMGAMLLSASVHAQAPVADAAILPPDVLAHASGEQIFQHICQACHMPDARGATGAGSYPALAGNAHLASGVFAASTVLFGRRDMPAFGPRPDLQGFEAMLHLDLSDAQIAAVVNYIRSHFGNHYADTLSAADVAALHPPTPHKP